MPLFSVIVPAYNSSATIVEALESVASQMFRDVEVIVVDDASTDHTPEVVKRWAGTVRVAAPDKAWPCGTAEGHRLSAAATGGAMAVLTLPRNSGPAAARNAGARQAKGEWLAFLDADDVWLPGKLAVQLACAAVHTEAAMICGGRREFRGTGDEGRGTRDEGRGTRGEGIAHDEQCTANSQRPTSNAQRPSGPDPRPPTLVPLIRPVTLEELARHNPIVTSTVLLRRSVFDTVGGFDEQFRGPEDYDLWIRVATRGAILEVKESLACYRHRPASLSLDERRFLPQVLGVLNKAYGPGGALHDRPEWRHAALATQYQQASWMAFSRHARCTALRYLALAWSHNCRGQRKIDKPWLAFAYRYLLGAVPGGEPCPTPK